MAIAPGRVKSGNHAFVVAALVLLLSVPGGRSEAQNPITSWEMIGPYHSDQVSLLEYPESLIPQATWLTVKADSTGLVNLDDQIQRDHRESMVVVARHVFHSPRDQQIAFNFGFADTIVVFFNREALFLGRNPGDLFDPTFSGDHRCSLQARKGLNEILFVVRSASEAWGFSAGTNIRIEPPQGNREADRRCADRPLRLAAIGPVMRGRLRYEVLGFGAGIFPPMAQSPTFTSSMMTQVR